jgi:hypothetical protein
VRPENSIILKSRGEFRPTARATETGLSPPAGNDKAVAMQAVVMAVVTSLASVVRSRMALQIEILALRHQLAVYTEPGAARI